MTLFERKIGRRVAGIAVAATLLVLGLAAPALAAIPTITSFLPTTGPVGCEVTITGTGFTSPSVTKVTFGADTTPVDQTTVIVDSSTQVRAAVPTGAVTGKLTVTNSDGTSAQSGGTFTVGATSCPTITLFSPTSGSVGASVTITGTNLGSATSVKFNGTSATITSNTAGQIVATVPTGATTGKITVTTAGGTGTSSTNFTVLAAPAPTITSFTPTSGVVGRTVTITGTNFSGTGFTTTSVKFNGTTATFTVNSATQITTTVPTGATTGKITVTTPGGTATSTTDFTVSALHARSVSLELRKHLVASGHVTVGDSFSACADSVPVKIQRRRRGGGWHTVKNTTTTSSGAYHARLNDVAGRYRARASRVVLNSGVDVCQGAISPTRRNR